MARTLLFNRVPRVQEPLPQGEVKLPGPPNVTLSPGLNWAEVLLPLAGIFVMVGVYGGVRGDWLLALPMVAMSGFSVITSMVTKKLQRKAQEKKVAEDQAAYANALEQKRAELEYARSEQQRIRWNTDPDLSALVLWAERREARLWDRRPEDADFLSLRLGCGVLPSSVKVTAPHPDMPDPRLEDAHRIEAEFAQVPGVPVSVDLRAGPVGIAGAVVDRVRVARALLVNLFVHHSPDEVQLLAVYSAARTSKWQWLKWLPHVRALDDESGQLYLANDSPSMRNVLGYLLEELHRRQNQLHATQGYANAAPNWPWIVVLLDDFNMVRDAPAIHLLLSPEARGLNVTAVLMVEWPSEIPTGCQGIVECYVDQQVKYAVAGPEGRSYLCQSDHADGNLCSQVARSLAPIQVYTLQSDSALPLHVRLLDLLKIRDLERYDVRGSHWEHHLAETYLQVPIGEQRGGQPLILDLNHTGHGPHGLVAGTTGSGKSELLQTLVVSLALMHHPYDVGFVLIDFKGGGTFSELQHLPHTLGMVTDLSGNLTTRALVALQAEVDRRKQLFADAGVNDITPYQQLYWQHRVKEPLPRLVLIVDEFAELVTDYPDFMDGLIAIARVGRSLGIHLILATQSPGGVVKQQIWANAKFRICLRVELRQESIEMLHRPEAANIPRIPGRGYLQVGNDEVFELFQVARVAGEYRVPGTTGELQRKELEDLVITQISSIGERREIFSSKSVQPKKKKSAGPTDLGMVVKKLVSVAQQMQIEPLPSPWPDPLPAHLPLQNLLAQQHLGGWDGTLWRFGAQETCPSCGALLRPGARFCPQCRAPVGQTCSQCGTALKPAAKFCPTCGMKVSESVAHISPDSPDRPWLTAFVGMVDDPAHQRQYPFSLDLPAEGGHLMVVGSPGSGKEMWLRSLVMSLATTHTPAELHFYLLEFGGQALKVFDTLPHVGNHLTHNDLEQIRRLLCFLLDFLEERKQRCIAEGVDTLLRLRVKDPSQAPAAIVVVLTGFAEFRNSCGDDEFLQLTRLIREGGPYGIHLVLAGDRAGDFPMSISSVIPRRVALRLADPDEYSQVLSAPLRVGRTQTIPYGRGWYGRPPGEFQTASPGVEQDEVRQLAEVQQVVTAMNQAWKGGRPMAVKALGTVGLRSLLEVPESLSALPQLAASLGVDALRMRPVSVELNQDSPNFIIAGTLKGGKTTLLWSWTLALAELNSPQQVQFVLVSGRRGSLEPLKTLPHVLAYCHRPDAFQQDQVLDHLLAEFERREQLLGPGGVLRESCPHLVMIVDDYNEFYGVMGSISEVKKGLETLGKKGRDVGIHMIVAGPMLSDLGASYSDELIKQLKMEHSGFLLRFTNTTDQNPFGVQVRAADIAQMPVGRGWLVQAKGNTVLQVATPGDSDDVTAWVARIRTRWTNAGCEVASWPERVVETTD